MRAEPISEFPYRAFVGMCFVLVFGAGWLGSYAVERMRDTARNDQGVRDTMPKTYAPWYVCDKDEVRRTCEAQKRMTKVKGKAT